MTQSETDIDRERLETFLATELDEEVVEIHVLHDGLNLILGVATRDEDQAYVIRRPNKLRHTKLFNSLEGEYRLLQRLQDTEMPTPVPVVFCHETSIVGDQFFVTSSLDGTTIPMRSGLSDRIPTEHARRTVGERLIDTLADIHSLPIGRFDNVCDYRSPRTQVHHAVNRLDHVRDVTGRDFPALREVARWLREHAPSDPETTLIHGDFKPGNVLFAGTDPPEITGVLDWETAALADPRTELAYFLLYWRDDGDPSLPIDDIEARYSNEAAIQEVRDINETGFYPFTTRPGSPTRRELVTRYEARSRVPFDNKPFYRAHAALMLGSVWADLHRHQIEASAQSDYEPLIDYMGILATSIIGEM